MVNLIRCSQCLKCLQSETLDRERPIHGFGDHLNLQPLSFVPMLPVLSDWFLISASSQCQASRSFWYSFFVERVINQSKAGRSFAAPRESKSEDDVRSLNRHRQGKRHSVLNHCSAIVVHSVPVVNGFILPSDFCFDHVHWAEFSFPVQVRSQFSSHLPSCCPNLWPDHRCNQHLFKSCSRMKGQVMVLSVSFLCSSESNLGNVCGWQTRPRHLHRFIQLWIHWPCGRTRLTKCCPEQRR
jgi:hypothetical protein